MAVESCQFKLHSCTALKSPVHKQEHPTLRNTVPFGNTDVNFASLPWRTVINVYTVVVLIVSRHWKQDPLRPGGINSYYISSNETRIWCLHILHVRFPGHCLLCCGFIRSSPRGAGTRSHVMKGPMACKEQPPYDSTESLDFISVQSFSFFVSGLYCFGYSWLHLGTVSGLLDSLRERERNGGIVYTWKRCKSNDLTFLLLAFMREGWSVSHIFICSLCSLLFRAQKPHSATPNEKNWLMDFTRGSTLSRVGRGNAQTSFTFECFRQSRR